MLFAGGDDMAQAKTRGIALPHLAAWRRAAFLTQRELSQRAGVSQSSITQLETGTHTARVATIEKLALALGIHREQLVKEDPEAKPETRVAGGDTNTIRPRPRRTVSHDAPPAESA
jgi:transcriptional regulator with XRE-family HTH domain